MNHQGSKMNIHITMGSEEGLQFLVDTDVTVTSNPPYVFFTCYSGLKHHCIK